MLRWNQSYQYAGRQPAFLLRGPPGKPGRDGTPGKAGKDGTAGTPGRDSRDGRDGAQGARGILFNQYLFRSFVSVFVYYLPLLVLINLLRPPQTKGARKWSWERGCVYTCYF